MTHLHRKIYILSAAFLLFMSLMTHFCYADNQNGLSYFTKKYEYEEDTFHDISKEWVKNALKSSYELGLINGKGKGNFDPNGFVTVAEAISFACRINNIYYGEGGEIDSLGSKWYDGAVIYAIDHNIIKAGEYANYEKTATRAEVANLFSHALPHTALKAINQITQLPDVSSFDPYFDPILLLYNAGILSGSDAYGTFYPEREITRAEIAVLLTRIALPDERKKITLLPSKNQPLTSADGSFTLYVSTDWKENTPYLSSQSVLELQADGGLCQLTASSTKKKDLLNFDLSTYSASYIKALSQQLNDASAALSKTMKINGHTAIISEIEGTVENEKISYYIMAVENDTQVILLSAIFPTSLSEECHPKVASLFQQFQSTKAK
ncbi:S-layer homology domain-containing protein [Sinanaerobacter sp. ZZT-01]|uniref:S-layer homology domain-containing protein n=1 Tax=Sinanaerobacter sp. ZZT-01 TaxID=3111540 RepID=UPI002D79C543|nr:S-layer homology domain-containing protein [Sinanaerobacter sp. ZZT-01]WRR93538.1 S-layer homology domain-containing protein [Sinanaerobacter sp. ZZT-01]